LNVLVGDREKAPYQNFPALPGGFVEEKDNGQALIAARRELREETGIDLPFEMLRHITVQDGLLRDPRGWIIDNVFGTVIAYDKVKAGDDLLNVRWLAVDLVGRMAFDHNDSLTKAMNLLVVSR
jgi:8-oxo-dGTP diphosphatase